MPEFIKAPESVIHLAAAIIREHHEQLQGASIGFVFRDYAPMKNGQAVFSETLVVPEKMKPYVNLDFLLIVAEDEWNRASSAQREAELDHAICHCMYHQGRPKLRPHDVEEFAVIIHRYGAYRRALERANNAFKFTQATQAPQFPGFQAEAPTLVAVDPSYFGE